MTKKERRIAMELHVAYAGWGKSNGPVKPLPQFSPETVWGFMVAVNAVKDALAADRPGFDSGEFADAVFGFHAVSGTEANNPETMVNKIGEN